MESYKKIKHKTATRLSKYRTAVNSAIVKGVREALLKYKRAGNRVAVSRNGNVAIVQPDDIAVSD